MPLLPPGVVYLSGVRNATTDAVVSDNYDVPLGLLVQPLTEDYLSPQKYGREHATGGGAYAWAGIDNGCFTAVGRAKFRLRDYLSLAERALHLWGDGLLFVTAPDEPFDWEGTLRKSLPVLPAIREVCPDRAALVLQDGATPENIPWAAVDALFIGGSTEWKVGPEARAITKAARRMHKWVHMGRVNSAHRMAVAYDFRVGSADGTYLLHATKLAKAVIATTWLYCPGGAHPDLCQALEALRDPSPTLRQRAITFLSTLARRYPLAARLAAARGADHAPGYATVLAEAVYRLAQVRRRSPGTVQQQVSRVSEETAVNDVLEWMRAIYRRMPAHEQFNRAEDYYAMLDRDRR